MPWCPKCKNEYREGVTVCADCGCPLISDGEMQNRSAVLFGEREELEKLKEFLEYNSITSSQIEFDENDQVYELFVAPEDHDDAMKFARVFVFENAKEELKDEEKEENEESSGSRLSVYESNEEKAKENKSSAIVLFAVGILGILFLLLCFFGVIPFRFREFVYIVMGAFFLILIVLGIISMVNSGRLSKSANSENDLTDSIRKWCLETFDASEIDREVLDGETDESILYFKRTQWMKDKIRTQFVNLDEAFLDYFLDNIYDEIFKEKDAPDSDTL